ncbi:zona pellucida sperm-binding protein 3-like [Pungitius pungitius]|uniref:zona pellucida sperm-binding protein 3-like n=1 Tax=Pungitius pungitius TaxID=134920 RepID=UPI002E11D5F6
MTMYSAIVLCLFFGAFSAAQDFKWKTHQANPNHQRSAPFQKTPPREERLSWRFPENPAEEEPRFPPEFEVKVPVAAESITAICGENYVWVEAKKDLLGVGEPVLSADLSLGGCPATGDDPERQVLLFESPLHGCGSQLLMSEDSFVYVFTLLYSPSPLGSTQITRARDAAIDIQCHYHRKQDVSSAVLTPTLSPFSRSSASEDQLYFSIKLVTDDWQFSRPAAEFFLGDMMKFEVSVRQFHHVPLRVTVDRCVATTLSHVDTVPRYVFLGNGGCLFDSQLTGSSSRFLPRSQNEKLQFQLEAFKFQQDSNGVIYITCNVRATVAAVPVDATNKACSFSNGWREASGNHKACSCCDSDCGTGSQGHATKTGAQWEEERAVGPITVKEKPLRQPDAPLVRGWK